MNSGAYKYEDGLILLKRDNIPLNWYVFFSDSTFSIRYRVMILDFVQWNWSVEINLN